MKISREQINQFVKNQSFILYGVSSNKQKFGNAILKELSAKGMNILPVHESLESVDGVDCYKNLDAMPSLPKAAIVCTKAENTIQILNELKEKGVRQVWLQQGSLDEKTAQSFTNQFDNLIHGKCIIMFSNPSGFHKFHAGILKFFGKYPK